MKAKNLRIGVRYRQKVNSKIGYDDWEYTGETLETDNGMLYAFSGVTYWGTQWFDEEGLKDFEFMSDEFEELRAFQFECKRLGEGQAFTNALKRHDEKKENS